MSAGTVIQAAVVAALRARAEFAEVAVFDAAPVRAAVPYAVVEAPQLRDAGAKGLAGRAGTVAVTLHDAGERPVRARALVGSVSDAVEPLAGDLGGGWRATGFLLARERMVRAGGDRWLAISEFAVRVWGVDG